MELTALFISLLDLRSPYSIEAIEHKKGDVPSVHIYIRISESYVPEVCNSIDVSVHDKEDRTWRHLDLFQYPCYLHCRVPKYKYREKGKTSYVKTLEVPWSRPGSGFTLAFESLVLGFVQLHGVVSRVAEQVGEYPQRIQTLINHYQPLEVLRSKKEASSESEVLQSLKDLQKEVEVEDDSFSAVRRLNIDETSRKKGHDYITNFIDADTKQLLDIQQGKGAKTIEQFVKKGLSKGLQVHQIEQVSIDMSPAFISGVETYFPNAAINFDKFHVSQLVNRCFDAFRKAQGRKIGTRLPKWSIIKPKDKLNTKEKKEVSLWLDKLPELDQFYQLKNQFAQLWQYEQPMEGAIFLAFWIGQLQDLAQAFKNQKMTTLANTLNKHFHRIINVLKSGMDNAISEGFNNKVQIMKRVARGYKTFEQYIQMVWLHCNITI